MRWDPFHQVVPLLTADEAPTRFMPDFQIEKTEDGFVFRADLLGIKENELDIALSGYGLTIRGHIYDARERSYAGFTRAFTLPEGSDPNRKIRAALDGGVLTVMLSKGLARVLEARALPCDDQVERWESEGGGAR
jgi:HSP20 family protein